MASRETEEEEEEEEEEEDQDEDEDEEEMEDGDEEEEEEEGPGIGRKIVGGRGVTLSKLLDEGLLKPGEEAMSIDYLGKRFVGDLLANGKIRCHETKDVFNSPSAWAKYCKKLVNPDKKSGCGWASVKYRHRNLTSFKSAWLKEKKLVEGEPRLRKASPKSDRRPDRTGARGEGGAETSSSLSSPPLPCSSFYAVGKMQPFTVTVSTECLFLVNYHCHLTSGEAVGYLAGRWDVHSHDLSLLAAFPCKWRAAAADDASRAAEVEDDVRRRVRGKGLRLAGWYHSHPASAPYPTARDVDCQMHYQLRMKGRSGGDASYTPCVGVICSPYREDGEDLTTYWVMPPPEIRSPDRMQNRPLERGRPMLMSCGVVREDTVSGDVVDEMKLLADYYRGAPDAVRLRQTWGRNGTYYDRMKATLTAHAAADQTEDSLDELLGRLLSDDY